MPNETTSSEAKNLLDDLLGPDILLEAPPEISRTTLKAKGFSEQEITKALERAAISLGQTENSSSAESMLLNVPIGNSRKSKGFHKIICHVCGDVFNARRIDTVICSGACRQRAYRGRKKSGL